MSRNLIITSIGPTRNSVEMTSSSTPDPEKKGKSCNKHVTMTRERPNLLAPPEFCRTLRYSAGHSTRPGPSRNHQKKIVDQLEDELKRGQEQRSQKKQLQSEQKHGAKMELKSAKTTVNVSVKEPVSVKVTFMRTNPNGSTKNQSCSGKAIRRAMSKSQRRRSV